MYKIPFISNWVKLKSSLTLKLKSLRILKLKSLRIKILLLFVMAVIVPVLIITTVVISITYRSLTQSIYLQQQEIMSRISGRISDHLEYNINLLRSTAKRNPFAMKKIKIISMFKNILNYNKNFTEIILLNRIGQEYVKIARKNNKPVTLRNLINRKNRTEFTGALAERNYISTVKFSPEKKPYLFISARYIQNVLLAKLDLKPLWDITFKTKIGKSKRGYVYVVDSKGILLAHPEKERVTAHADFSGLQVVKDFLNKKPPDDTRHTYTDETGEKVVSFYYPIPDTKDEEKTLTRIPDVNWAVVAQIPHQEVYSPIMKIITQIILWSTFFCLICILIGTKFVSNLINPLQQLKSLAGSISKGKFDVKINIKTGDEIEELALTFNNMAVSLRELEQIRQDLISMIVHDMKSPLSGIMGSLDYLETTETPVANKKNLVSLAKKSAENLLNMIQNLLDISRMEENKLTLNKRPVKVDELIGDTVTQHTMMAEAENKKVIVELGDNLPELNIDQMIINRVVNNLLSNALHHTISDGKIWLRVNRTNDELKFSVADNGMGIPKEYRDKIFEKFVQVERKRAHLRTGTGLGLTFCKMAVELHGGQIWVESEQSKGSSFAFTLPVIS